MLINDLVKEIEKVCYKPSYRIYRDETQLKDVPAVRYKLSYARISDEALKKIKLRYENTQVGESERVLRISRNDFTTGGVCTSKEDVCIYISR